MQASRPPSERIRSRASRRPPKLKCAALTKKCSTRFCVRISIIETACQHGISDEEIRSVVSFRRSGSLLFLVVRVPFLMPTSEATALNR